MHFSWTRWFRLTIALVVTTPGLGVLGQFTSESPAGISAGFARLFEVSAFTANAHVQVFEPGGTESLRTQMKLAFLDGKMRMDIDVGQLQGQTVEPAVIAALKQAGLDRICSVVRLDQKIIHLVFPGARSVVSMPMSKAEAELAGQDLKVVRVADGSETIGGRLCTRTKVRVTNPKGISLLEATTWTAADLKNFPVQIAVRADGKTTLVRFTQVQMKRPEPTLFESPSKFAKYRSVEMLLFASIQKQGGLPATTDSAGPPRGAAPRPAAKGAAPRTSPGPGSSSAPVRTQKR